MKVALGLLHTHFFIFTRNLGEKNNWLLSVNVVGILCDMCTISLHSMGVCCAEQCLLAIVNSVIWPCCSVCCPSWLSSCILYLENSTSPDILSGYHVAKTPLVLNFACLTMISFFYCTCYRKLVSSVHLHFSCW